MDSITQVSRTTDYALQMAVKGWRVFPCHEITAAGHCSCNKKADCSSSGKHPRIKAWQEHATTDPDQIVRWWKRWPTANIGIQTGSRSNLCVLDFDPRHGGQDTLVDLQRKHPEIVDTFRVATGGGGWHLYFRNPDGGSKTLKDILPGMDVRGDGGLVIAAGSIHSSGVPYSIQHAGSILVVPDGLLPLVAADSNHHRTYEGTKEQLRNNRRATEEQQKQNRKLKSVAEKPLNFDTLSDEQRTLILKAIERSIPERSGRRNAQTLILARRLLSVPGISKTTSPDSLRPIVQRWYDMAVAKSQELNFTIHGSFIQTMDDFRYSFRNARCPMNTAMSGIIEKVSDGFRENRLPERVVQCAKALGYTSDKDTLLLITLCWHLNQLWEPEGFPLAARSAATALESIGTNRPRNFQWVSRTMTHLERDNVLRCLERVPSGKRGQSNRYLWVWTPPEDVPQLDWLTGGTSTPAVPKTRDLTKADQLRALAELDAKLKRQAKSSPDI